MVEIMEPTDFAVRIEFERGGYVLPEEARFMGRGVDFALSMFNFDKMSIEEVRKKNFLRPKLIRRYNDAGVEYSLIDEEAIRCFRVKRLDVVGALETKEKSFYVGIVTRGNGKVSCAGLTRDIRTGEKFFVPFRTDQVRFESRERMEILLVLPPR